MSRTIPITLISGFRGAGKSSLVQQLKRNGSRLAFLEDDGEKDLFHEIEEASRLEAADAIIIECAANLEPFFIAEHLVDGDDENPPAQGVHVDTLVTVVDAANLLKDIQGKTELIERDLAFDDDDDRLVPELLIEQIEFADVLILNKVDAVSTERADELEALLARLNPRAKILRAEHGRVPPQAIVNTGSFDLEQTDDGAGWLWELSGEFRDGEGGFGVTSFTFLDRCPFHPERFIAFIKDFAIQGLVRAKGYVWVASRHNEIGIWSLSGRASLLTYGGHWFASTPMREWPTDERERLEIMQDWMAPFGDRRQEIAFIGLNMSEADVRTRLEKCLVRADEMVDAPDSWVALADPLPDWHTDPESYRG
jgi:G3E family GTPase